PPRRPADLDHVAPVRSLARQVDHAGAVVGRVVVDARQGRDLRLEHVAADERGVEAAAPGVPPVVDVEVDTAEVQLAEVRSQVLDVAGGLQAAAQPQVTRHRIAADLVAEERVAGQGAELEYGGGADVSDTVLDLDVVVVDRERQVVDRGGNESE